ncbi:rod shape-determining protein MreC [Candidatus Ishikawella capsulata]|uniref:Cell shape-determining protein MreC n=1 Tax=Candidatus Ishikawaella capsulata Mpkobe TaxID=476281 RepID=C5WCJ1_9ENTR|nr:rod shape-determining protein MreC [Candidatus Ishikawaella capsulata]BAH83047.1 cell wall structural complex MreBCD [Candidatus Ishikawaella capsulata Mpkobe]
MYIKRILSKISYSLKDSFILIMILAIMIIIIDSYVGSLIRIRSYFSPFYFLISGPVNLIENISNVFISESKQRIIQENKNLRKDLFLKNLDLLKLSLYQTENKRLRMLLGAPFLLEEKKTLVKVILNSTYNHINQIIINKGNINGVYIGQPVIDEKGLIGQVIEVSKLTSRVLLIYDPLNYLPIQNLRSGIRLIARGKGFNKDFRIKYFTDNLDVCVGDMMVTSAGSQFPTGYPVMIIYKIIIDKIHGNMIIYAHPTANFDNLNYELLLWPSYINKIANISQEEVNNITNKRFHLSQ